MPARTFEHTVRERQQIAGLTHLSINQSCSFLHHSSILNENSREYVTKAGNDIDLQSEYNTQQSRNQGFQSQMIYSYKRILFL